MTNGLTRKELKKAIKKVNKDIRKQDGLIDHHIDKLKALEFIRDTLILEYETGIVVIKKA